MKIRLPLAFAAIFLLVGIWFALRTDAPKPSSIPRTAATPASTPIFAPAPPPPAAEPLVQQPADPEATIEADKVSLMLRDYRTLFQENPVGTNAEIMKSIMAGNPKQAVLGPPEGQKLNAKGELLDKWGTPYFFHQLSAKQMEIHSAGPDKIMWNGDDIVVQ